jgi:coenzyme F420 hydrogenase subunit beta
MKFNKNNINYFIGDFENCYTGYSNDEEIRNGAASGGIVSGVLINLLKENKIQGALVSRMQIKDGKLIAESFIAKSKEEILDARTSIYFETPLLSKIQEIKSFKGKLAVVGVPCQITALRKICKDKISYYIGLFCGHNSKKDLILKVLKKKNIDLDKVKRFYFRKGMWRGKSFIEFKDGSKREFPFTSFSVYQNLHFLSQKKCIVCSDHCAENADLSCGDIWTKEYKKREIKHSAFVSRNKEMDKILHKSNLNLEEVPPLMIAKAQKRSLIYHKSINSRSFVGKFFGYKIPKNDIDKIRLNDLISAFIIMVNDKVSDTKSLRNLMFKVPKKVMNLYLYFFKILTNF